MDAFLLPFISAVSFFFVTWIYRRQMGKTLKNYYMDLAGDVRDKNHTCFDRLDMHVELEQDCSYLIIEVKYLTDTSLEIIRKRRNRGEKELGIAINTNSGTFQLGKADEKTDDAEEGKFDASLGQVEENDSKRPEESKEREFEE